jgi:hypothetical protein
MSTSPTHSSVDEKKQKKQDAARVRPEDRETIAPVGGVKQERLIENGTGEDEDSSLNIQISERSMSWPRTAVLLYVSTSELRWEGQAAQGCELASIVAASATTDQTRRAGSLLLRTVASGGRLESGSFFGSVSCANPGARFALQVHRVCRPR